MKGAWELEAGVGDHTPRVRGYVLVAHELRRLRALDIILLENGED